MEATLTMVKSVLNRSELNEVVDETKRRREETNEVVEKSTLEVADSIFGPLIYGTIPSVNIPFLTPTSSRRRAIGSGGGVFPDLAFQHKLEGDYQMFVSSAVNPVAFTIQLVSEESQLMCIQGDLNKMVLSMSSLKFSYKLRQLRFPLFHPFQSLLLSKKAWNVPPNITMTTLGTGLKLPKSRGRESK
jgi:hypothetical protein